MPIAGDPVNLIRGPDSFPDVKVATGVGFPKVSDIGAKVIPPSLGAEAVTLRVFRLTRAVFQVDETVVYQPLLPKVGKLGQSTRERRYILTDTELFSKFGIKVVRSTPAPYTRVGEIGRPGFMEQSLVNPDVQFRRRLDAAVAEGIADAILNSEASAQPLNLPSLLEALGVATLAARPKDDLG